MNTARLSRTIAVEFWHFGLKQARASMFGGYLLGLILITKLYYPIDNILYRNDFLFLAAVAFQFALLAFRLETPKEAVVILVFHVVATGMEVFKTSDAIKSWQYPGDFRIGIGNVPLFAGFMYSAVGSYIARVWRIFDFKFSNYPPVWSSWVLVTLVYANFFTHHYTVDIRWPLLIGSAILFGRCNVYFKIRKTHRFMPLIIGWFLVATFIWIAENIATYSRIWIYPTQGDQWHLVPVEKLVAWYLLMLLSFVLVSLVSQPEPPTVSREIPSPPSA